MSEGRRLAGARAASVKKKEKNSKETRIVRHIRSPFELRAQTRAQ